MGDFDVTQAAKILGALGGLARAKRHSRIQMRAWGKLGGRPPKLSPNDLGRMRRLLAAGRTQLQVAEALGVATRTVARYVAKGIQDELPDAPAH